MALQYLQFDHSDATDDIGSFDTMASASPAALPALHAELAQVLGWAHRRFPHGRGPLDEGYAWDYDLQATQELTRRVQLTFDALTGGFESTPSDSASLRHTVSLSISGTAAFCAAFCGAFYD